ncbi:MAG: minor extracellular protease Epr [Gaiellaceae bacterium]|nr:minor extracellular protease Epr [Gaiellaceae bacterium]
MLRVLPALIAVALVAAAPAAAFTPADPLAAKQWYLADDHAFDAWATPPPDLVPVRVAIVDSGVDGTLPDFAGRIAESKSFVGGSPLVDTEGHGTFVAGEIAANLDTQGIAGIAYTSQLLIAKVVKPDGTIPLEAEAAAIRWAADQGARVINLSLGGVRDPVHRERDTYSPAEAAAVAYAYGKGALLVAAVGNGDEAFAQPWPYASYPAALPHVIGVSALTRSGGVPDFSNRDAVYNDISAPGQGIFSTFPLAMTALRVGCVDQGYSDCGTDEYRNPEGTSFAAPQVSAAAAVLFAVSPQLTNGQVAALLEHTAVDVNAATGCSRCALLRDPLSGWGRLDVAKAVEALAGPIPPPDRYETNDDAGTQARTMWGKQVTIDATVDYYDDQIDVYRVALSGGEKVDAKLVGGWSGANVSLVLWKPGTRRVEDLRAQKLRVAQSTAPGSTQRLTFTAPGRGWYYVEVKVTAPGSGPYTLTLSKTTTPPKR